LADLQDAINASHILLYQPEIMNMDTYIIKDGRSYPCDFVPLHYLAGKTVRTPAAGEFDKTSSQLCTDYLRPGMVYDIKRWLNFERKIVIAAVGLVGALKYCLSLRESFAEQKESLQ
jgi:hypothetical protein